MATTKTTVLLIEDDRIDQKAFERMVKDFDLPYNYKIADTVAQAKQELQKKRFDIVITDYILGDGKSFEVFDSIINTPIIFITGAGDQEIAVQAMKAGAYDYLIKDPERNYLKFLPITVENAIKHSEAERQLRLLESAVINANDAVLITEAGNYDMPGPKVVYVNDAFTKMTHFKPAEIIGQSPRILQGPKTGREALDRIKKALKNNETCREELINYTKEDSEYWVDLNIVPLRDNKGNLTHYLSIQRDVTEKKLSEHKLNNLLADVEKSHNDKLAILNELKIGTAITDNYGCITFISRYIEDLFKIKYSKIKGKTWYEVFNFRKEDRAKIEITYKVKPELREKIPVSIEIAPNVIFWMEIELKDDPRDPNINIFFFYDVTEIHELRLILDQKNKFQDLIGKSEVMKNIYEKIKEVSKIDWTVLIEGATGTGKELVAKAIHMTSDRKDNPFIAVNCGALTESLLTSQLFGHKKGSFTGALSDQQGLFEAANGGTIFLDEIGDIPINIQTNLLRVIQEKEITRIGESKARKIDVRVISASQHDLIKEVENGNFRADLLYRIRVTRINLPDLKDRKEDIPLLVNTFLNQIRASTGKTVYEISGEAMSKLLNYNWPGNVRELKSAIDFSSITCKGSVINIEDLPPEINQPDTDHIKDYVIQDEKQKILAALEQTSGNRKKASKLLGMSRATFYRRLLKHELI